MKYGIGIDIGGTKISCALVDKKGSVHKKIIFHTAKNKQKIVNQIVEGISLLLEGDKSSVLGIGVGIPGVVDPKNGKIAKLPNLNYLNGLDLIKILKKKFRKKVLMQNDASCAARCA